jgi:hypothetical protein
MLLDRHRVVRLIELADLERRLTGTERILREEEVALFIKAAYDDASDAARAAFVASAREMASAWPWSAVQASGTKPPAALVLLRGQAESADIDPGNRIPDRGRPEAASWGPLHAALDAWDTATLRRWITPRGWLVPAVRVAAVMSRPSAVPPLGVSVGRPEAAACEAAPATARRPETAASLPRGRVTRPRRVAQASREWRRRPPTAGDATNWGDTPVDLRPLFMYMEEVSRIEGSARVFAVIAYRESRFVTTAHNGNAEPSRTSATARARPTQQQGPQPAAQVRRAGGRVRQRRAVRRARAVLPVDRRARGRQEGAAAERPARAGVPAAGGGLRRRVYMQRLLANYRIDDIADIKAGWANPSLLGKGRGRREVQRRPRPLPRGRDDPRHRPHGRDTIPPKLERRGVAGRARRVRRPSSARCRRSSHDPDLTATATTSRARRPRPATSTCARRSTRAPGTRASGRRSPSPSGFAQPLAAELASPRRDDWVRATGEAMPAASCSPHAAQQPARRHDNQARVQAPCSQLITAGRERGELWRVTVDPTTLETGACYPDEAALAARVLPRHGARLLRRRLVRPAAAGREPLRLADAARAAPRHLPVGLQLAPRRDTRPGAALVVAHGGARGRGFRIMASTLEPEANLRQDARQVAAIYRHFRTQTAPLVARLPLYRPGPPRSAASTAAPASCTCTRAASTSPASTAHAGRLPATAYNHILRRFAASSRSAARPSGAGDVGAGDEAPRGDLGRPVPARPGEGVARAG